MRCETALERMLEAGPVELRGEGDTDLAAHIGECGRCARAAETILMELEAIDRALAEYAEGAEGVADAAADAALAASREQAADVVPFRGGAVRPGEVVPVPPRRSWLDRAWIPAVAAAIAAVLLIPGDDSLRVTPTAATAEPTLAVRPPPDRGAAIMQTENPNITIVWLYEREGT